MCGTEKTPNVLMISADQWPGPFLGCAGRSDIMTPTLDYLAENGTCFENCYSECPVCIPTRRSLMTGLSPKSHETECIRTVWRCRMSRPWRRCSGRMATRLWRWESCMSIYSETGLGSRM